MQGVTHFSNSTSNPTAHAFRVASVLGGNSGVAPNVTFYFASINAAGGLVNGINWLVSHDVDIINLSWGEQIGSGNFNANSAFLDHISRSVRISVVVASGNSGNTGVSSFATGLNVIGVGSTDLNRRISSFSSAGVTHAALRQPTVVAPGGAIRGVRNINVDLSGTSFAAPIVSGIIALLMEEFATLRGRPETVKALLAASAVMLPDQTQLFNVLAGAGMVNYTNARNMMRSSGFNSFVVGNHHQVGDVVASRTISASAGNRLFVTLSTSSNRQQTTIGSGTLTPTFTRYIVRIVNTGTGAVVGTISHTSNLLMGEVLIPTSGNFRIEIVLNSQKVDDYFDMGAFAFYQVLPPPPLYMIMHVHHPSSGNVIPLGGTASLSVSLSQGNFTARVNWLGGGCAWVDIIPSGPNQTSATVIGMGSGIIEIAAIYRGMNVRKTFIVA